MIKPNSKSKQNQCKKKIVHTIMHLKRDFGIYCNKSRLSQSKRISDLEKQCDEHTSTPSLPEAAAEAGV